MIIKPKVKDHFVAIPNYLLWEFDLSATAMGVLAFIRSMPSNWSPQTSHMCKALKMSAKTLFKYLHELVNKGLLEIIEMVDERGRFTGVKTFVLHHPEKPKKRSISYEEYMRATEWERSPKAPNSRRVFKFCLAEQTPQDGELEEEEGGAERARLGSAPVKQNLPSLIISTFKKHDLVKEDFSENFKHSSPLSPPNVSTEVDTPHPGPLSVSNFSGHPKKVKKDKGDVLSALAKGVFSAKLEELKAIAESAFNMDLAPLKEPERAAYERFINYRREFVKVGYESKRAILEQFKRLSAANEDIPRCVDRAITRGYSQVYALSDSDRLLRFKSASENAKAMEMLNGVMEAFRFLNWGNIEDSLHFALRYTSRHYHDAKRVKNETPA